MGNLDQTSLSSQMQQSVSDRRRHLRHQRRWLMLQRFWQLMIVGGLAWGVGWLMSRPGWVLTSPESIHVDGIIFLSPKAVRSQLPIQYPQSLFRLPTDALETHLEALDPIAEATIVRTLFPPQLTIHIQEYRPVAILLGNSYGDIDAELYDLNGESLTNSGPVGAFPFPGAEEATGFVDANGTWLPLASYDEVEEGLGELPTLELVGMRREYRVQWGTLYEQIQRSPVNVERVDWRQLDNLTLQTDVGTTHHGVYDPETFSQQLDLIDRMREIDSQMDLDDVLYFDLRSPETPFVQYDTRALPIPGS